MVGYYTSEKDYDRVPWCLVFLRTALPSSCVQIKSWFKLKGWSLMAISDHCLLYLRYNVLTLYSLWVLLNSQASWVHQNLCSWGIEMLYANSKEGHTCILCLFPLLIHMLQAPSEWKKLSIYNYRDCDCMDVTKWLLRLLCLWRNESGAGPCSACAYNHFSLPCFFYNFYNRLDLCLEGME